MSSPDQQRHPNEPDAFTEGFCGEPCAYIPDTPSWLAWREGQAARKAGAGREGADG